MSLATGLCLALFSALTLNLSYFGQHRATREIGRLSPREPLRSLGRLFSHPGWLFAYLAGWLGWAAYVAALHFAPLSLVQAISAGGVGLLVLFSRAAPGATPPREREGAIIASLGLICVIATLGAGESSRTATFAAIALLVTTGLAAAALALLALRHRLTIGLSVAAGLSYGVGDVATKGAVSGTAVLIPIFLLCHLLGFIATQLAYQRGTLIESAGLSSLLANAIPLIAGVVLFGEAPPGGPLGALRIVGFAAALCGGALITRAARPATEARPLPRSPANNQESSAPD